MVKTESNIEEKIVASGLSIEKYEEILNTIVQKKQGEIDMDWSEIISQYGLDINKDSLRKANDTIFGGFAIYQYLSNRTLKSQNNIKNTELETSINKDGSISSKRLITMNDEQKKDPNFILQAHGFDTKL